MSKALVIKGANFVQNAIEQIAITNPIPCTGITISQNILNLTEIGATATLTATVTPSDTTEAVIWHSSNENVVTVNNGQVTCVGVGSAIISASCGTQSASCNVRSTVTIDDTSLYAINGRYIQSTDLTVSPIKDYVAVSPEGSGTSNAGRSRTHVYSSRPEHWNKPFNGTIAENYGPIPIPNGTSTIKVKADDFYNVSDAGDMLVLEDATTLSTYNVGNKGSRAVSNLLYDVTQTDGFFVWDISDRDSSANSFVFTIRSKYEEASTLTSPVTITFE